MRENQLPVHNTSAEETGQVRPAVDSSDGGVHILVTHVDARPAGNYLADDLSNSVRITMAHSSAALSASPASAVAAAPRALRDSKSRTWLLASAVISVTTLYTICNPTWVPSFVAQISKQLSAGIKRRASTALGGTAVADAAKAGAGTVAGAAGIHVAPSGGNSASTVPPKGETANHTASRNSGDSAEAKTSKSKNALMVPPPPATPCLLPPALGSFPAQPAQQDAAPQQERENTPQQPTAASGTTEASQSAALDAAEQELQAALKSSQRTVGEWTR
jgi:hypothetical protein